MPSISVTNPDKVTVVDLGTASPKIGGSINLDKFTSLQQFIGKEHELVSLQGTEAITTLTKLSAFRNLISQPIPSFAANTSITEIFLYINSFTGSLILPASGNTLQKLEVFRNQLTGSIPALPTSLTSLQLHENSLSGSIPTLNTSSGLIKITLNQNTLTGSIPALPASVQELKLHVNQLTGSIPTLPTTLKKLDVSNNNLDDGSGGGNGTIPLLGGLTSLSEYKVNSQSVSFGTAANNSSGTDKWNGPASVASSFTVPLSMRVFKAHQTNLTPAAKKSILTAFYHTFNAQSANYAKTTAINGITYNGTAGPTPEITVYNNRGKPTGNLDSPHASVTVSTAITNLRAKGFTLRGFN